MQPNIHLQNVMKIIYLKWEIPFSTNSKCAGLDGINVPHDKGVQENVNKKH